MKVWMGKVQTHLPNCNQYALCMLLSFTSSTSPPSPRNAHMLLVKRYNGLVQMTRDANVENNMFNEKLRRELSPVHSKWRKRKGLDHLIVLSFEESLRGCQAAFNASFGFLHLLGSDVLRLFGHIRLMLRNIRAVSNGHTNSYLS